MSGGAGYAQRHLEHSDYYDEHRRVQGEWQGRGAELLGLSGNVTPEQFEAIREGLNPETGELMFTTVPDVDLDARKVTLRVTKSGKTRVAYITDLAMQVFESMGIRERKRQKDRGVLFPGVTPEQLSMRFIRVCRDAGIEDFSFHDLRHTYASQLRIAGADLDYVRRMLGHSDLRMTLRYSHLGPDDLDSTAMLLDGRLSLPTPDAALPVGD